MDPLLQLEKISKNYGPIHVLDEADFTLASGEAAVVLGPSGVGKSTLLHLAGLMERPTSGRILLNGRRVDNATEKERALLRLDAIGFLFQFHHLLPEFNVMDNILMPCRLAGDNIKESGESAERLLERLGLAERLHHRPHQLSGGEQQRAALARALIRKPQVLFCDEPTGNLDQETAHSVMALIYSIVEKDGLATVIVTHNDSFVRYARHVYRLSNGRLFEAIKEPVAR